MQGKPENTEFGYLGSPWYCSQLVVPVSSALPMRILVPLLISDLRSS